MSYRSSKHGEIWIWWRSQWSGGWQTFLQDVEWFSVLCTVNELQLNVWLWRFLVWWMLKPHQVKFCSQTMEHLSHSGSCMCPAQLIAVSVCCLFLKLFQNFQQISSLSCTVLQIIVFTHVNIHSCAQVCLSVCLQTLCNCLVCLLLLHGVHGSTSFPTDCLSSRHSQHCMSGHMSTTNNWFSHK